MEKLKKPYEEYMKIAMLKHEETFKEQLYELHRLYRIQKMLMKNVEKSRGIELNQQGWNLKHAISLTQNAQQKVAPKRPQMKFDLERPAEEHMAEPDGDGDGMVEMLDETEIELTLGPSSFNPMKKVETPLTSDSGHSLSSSSTGSSHINKTTSRTHHGGNATREELSGDIIGLVQVPDSNSGCQSGVRNGFDIEEQSRQDKFKKPPWLFQVLTLNIT